MIYNEDDQFFIKFGTQVSVADRLRVLDDVRRKIMGRASYFQKEFCDKESHTTDSSADTIVMEAGPTPSEAYN